MKAFMDENFLLGSETARSLYHSIAKHLPIIDYHCHLSPKEIAQNLQYNNITEVWLYGDHYKWRAMRSCGVPEALITGDGSDFEKFRAYCACMPKLIGNPLYHWSHLELRQYFDCDLTINEKNCEEIWRITAEKLQSGQMGARDLILASNVDFIGTTDDPADSLEWHAMLRDEGFPVRVAPSFRPDKCMAPNAKDFTEYIGRLGDANGVRITDLDSLCAALKIALDRFETVGCRAADHGFNDAFLFVTPDPYHANEIFTRALAGKTVSDEESALLRAQLLRFLAGEYTARGIVMQLHFGPLRNTNTAMFKKLGADTGFDVIHGANNIAQLARLLDYLNSNDRLPRTILYSLNGADNEAVAVLCGAFAGSGDGEPRVLQGSAWWFCDNIDGMRDQMRSFARLACFGKFLGMLTDSRSFLSYPRHAYFRRILCDLIGNWVENGEYPNDEASLAALVKDICHDNAERYFGL